MSEAEVLQNTASWQEMLIMSLAGNGWHGRRKNRPCTILGVANVAARIANYLYMGFGLCILATNSGKRRKAEAGLTCNQPINLWVSVSSDASADVGEVSNRAFDWSS